MTSQGKEDEIKKRLWTREKEFNFAKSGSNKNLLVTFNQVHTVIDFSLSSSETSFRYSDSLQEVFYKKGVLRNFAKFKGKNPSL